MSSLVGAVKTYAYMDRGELVEVDLHEGLETTLIVLGHKLKHTAIEVERDYDRDLPRLTVRGSELNQVWTNLLDNAIDALGETGTITIARGATATARRSTSPTTGPASRRGHATRSSTRSSRPRTSGQGTGLGLATARRIVVDRHDGSLTVESEPGGRPSTSGCRSPTPTEGPPMAHAAPTSTTSTITELPESVDGCVDCLAMGGLWLHLRICLECGHVGCCDDSPNRHATAHAPRDGPPDHPLARARRGLVLVLRRRGRDADPGRPRPDAHTAVSAPRVSTEPRSGTAEGLDLRQAPARLEVRDATALGRAVLGARVEGVTRGADVHAQTLARRAEIVLGAAVAAADARLEVLGMDRGVHASASRIETARRRLSSKKTIRACFGFPGSPVRRPSFHRAFPT